MVRIKDLDQDQDFGSGLLTLDLIDVIDFRLFFLSLQFLQWRLLVAPLFLELSARLSACLLFSLSLMVRAFVVGHEIGVKERQEVTAEHRETLIE